MISADTPARSSPYALLTSALEQLDRKITDLEKQTDTLETRIKQTLADPLRMQTDLFAGPAVDVSAVHRKLDQAISRIETALDGGTR